jgi:hypothetical protein
VNIDPRQILCELIATYSLLLCDDVVRCEAFLRDYWPHDRGRVNVFVGAVRERVAADLLSGSELIPVELQIARSVKRLEDHLAMREDIAKWAVESWAIALGIVKQPTTVTSESAELVRTRKAADQGAASAQFNMGLQYAKGGVARQDFDEAAQWFRKAAHKGHAGAQYILGVLHVNGDGVPQDQAEAVKWFQKAAEQGHVEALKQI